MSEQKYYVKLKLDGQLLGYGGFYDEGYGCDEDNEFTKKELAKIMDGALYSPTVYGQVIDGKPIIVRDEWINPLIELVPVEDDE